MRKSASALHKFAAIFPAAAVTSAALAKFARAGVLLALLLIPGTLLAQGQVSPMSIDRRTGKINFGAGVLEEKFRHFTAKQQTNKWCWAACVQMVLHYQGIKVGQEEIVKRAKGRVVLEGGTVYDMINGANGWRVNGRVLRAHGKSWPDVNASKKDLIDYLAKKHPIIVGLNIPGRREGHAYVLTAIFYQTTNNNANGPKIPYAVVLRDPSPYLRNSREEMPWDYFASHINCVIYVHPQ